MRRLQDRGRRGLAPIPPDPGQALEPFNPDQGHGPWDRRQAGHLLRRAIGESSPAQVERAAAQTPAQLLDELFAAPDPERAALQARIGRQSAVGDRQQLAGWWLLKFLQEERATGARLSFFWHDHFACAQSKVEDLGDLFQQHQLFVERGAGPFVELLLAVARDPAMLRFLDGDTNRRGVPNENLAREIFELFTLGVGNYTEEDVREASRALTGRTIRDRRYAFVEEYHDRKPKQVLGRTIQDGDDLCRVAVSRPACPRFLARKFWRYYVSPEAPEEIIELLSERWQEHDLEVAWLLRTLLGSRAFHSADAYRALVKSPVDYVIGTVRVLEAKPDLGRLATVCDRMGQKLFEPPGVQGWKEGDAWIHSAAWIERANFAAEVCRGDEDVIRGAKVDRLFPPGKRNTATGALDLLEAVFLQDSLPPERRRALVEALSQDSVEEDSLFQTAAQAVLCLPAYHLA